jgi:alkylation response protein AidB-like acyl-CoA dehydrogenase
MQKQKYLPAIASGKAIFTLALNETGGAYTASSINTKAVAESEGYVISGAKLFVPDAHVADYILVAARTGEKTEDGITLFIVDAKAAGLGITPLKTIANDHLCEIVFENVKVPKENILGRLNGSWELLGNIMEKAAIAKCCTVIGAMETVLDMTVEYAKERKQYGQPIGSFQVIQHYCANMAIDTDASRFITYQAAWKLSEGKPCRKETAEAKSWVNEAFDRFISLSHQIHGAIGVTIDHDLQYYTKRAKAATLTFGGSDYHRETVAQEMGL